MGKRSNYERVERDYYPTPYEAAIPLIPYLPKKTKFVEPMAGDYRLAGHFEKHGHECVYACDLEPQSKKVVEQDVLFFGCNFPKTDMIITNPPWNRDILHPIIDIFRMIAPTWLLFDAGWMHTGQAAPYKKYCKTVISVGRVKWIEGSDSSGMDDCCWYNFVKDEIDGETQFIWR